jgi:hypothetical protein
LASLRCTGSTKVNCARMPVIYIDRDLTVITAARETRKRPIESIASRYFYIPRTFMRVNANAMAVNSAASDRAFKNPQGSLQLGNDRSYRADRKKAQLS